MYTQVAFKRLRERGKQGEIKEGEIKEVRLAHKMEASSRKSKQNGVFNPFAVESDRLSPSLNREDEQDTVGPSKESSCVCFGVFFAPKLAVFLAALAPTAC